MKISVIVPIYNVEKYIEQCLTSILKQSYKNLEIILVNDGTKDNSMRVIKKYLSDPRIKIINKKNGGLSSARNTGLAIATGEYISFIDSDDWIKSDLYEKLCNNLKDEDIILFEYLPIKKIKDLKKLELKKEKYIRKQKSLTGEKMEIFFKKVSWACWTKLYKKEFLEKNNFRFIENIIYEDINWEIETIFSAKKIKYIPFLGYYYRTSRKGSIMNSKKEDLHKESCKIIEKRIESFLNKNQSKVSKGVLGSLLLEIERLKCEFKDEKINSLEVNKIFYTYILKKGILKEERIRLLNDYINFLSVYSFRNKSIILKVYIFKIIRKVIFKLFL